MFNNKYWTTISIGICLLALVFVTVFSIEKNQAGAEQMESLDEVFDRIGPYFKNHPELLSASLKAVEDFNSISDDDCVAKVNNVPISIAEIEFMKGLKDAFEERNSSYQSVFDMLVDEKVVFDYAMKNDLIPSKSEVDEFIAWEKDSYESDTEYQKDVNMFCEKAGMSLDEYWDTYERYNAFRLVLFKKAYDHAISQAISNKQLIIDNVDEVERIKLKEAYWNSFKKELKKQANIKISKNYDHLKLSVGTE
jgi:hypothetical protein